MKKYKRTSQEIITDTKEILFSAKLGLEFLKNPEHRILIAGIRNVIVFGRSITFILQNLKTPNPDTFEAWYLPHVEKMEKDSLMKYFSNLRTEIVHRGDLKIKSVGVTVHLDAINLRFIDNPDHKDESKVLGIDYFVDMENLPAEYSKIPIYTLCSNYLDYMESLIKDAEMTFQ